MKLVDNRLGHNRLKFNAKQLYAMILSGEKECRVVLNSQLKLTIEDQKIISDQLDYVCKKIARKIEALIVGNVINETRVTLNNTTNLY